MKTIKMDYDEYVRMQTRLKILEEVASHKTVFIPWDGGYPGYPDYTEMQIITTEKAEQILKGRTDELRKAHRKLVNIKRDIADRKEIKKTHWLIKKPW